MTTIAAIPGEIWADSLVTDSCQKWKNVEKLVQLGPSCVVGMAGAMSGMRHLPGALRCSVKHVSRWYYALPNSAREGSSYLFCGPDIVISADDDLVTATTGFAAIGSGAACARAAHLAGANLKGAVQIAASIDLYSGGQLVGYVVL
jgi:predicted NAD/FAD-dependent oxidoreductase